MGKLVFQLTGAFADFERTMISGCRRFSDLLVAHAGPASVRGMESRDDRLAIGADDVCCIVLVLIVGFEYVERG
jgi:hypothetical protein